MIGEIAGGLKQLWMTTGIVGFFGSSEFGLGNLVMILVGFVLLYLAIKKGFEPLLLIPSGSDASCPTSLSRISPALTRARATRDSSRYCLMRVSTRRPVSSRS